MAETLFRAFDVLRGRRSLIGRVAFVLLALGGVALWQRSAPQDVDIELELGREHRTIRRVDVDYLENDELVHHVSFRYPEGAPASIRHRANLGPGDYLIEVGLATELGPIALRHGRLHTPAEGVVRVALSEEGGS